jgi:hypothetical protein
MLPPDYPRPSLGTAPKHEPRSRSSEGVRSLPVNLELSGYPWRFTIHVGEEVGDETAMDIGVKVFNLYFNGRVATEYFDRRDSRVAMVGIIDTVTGMGLIPEDRLTPEQIETQALAREVGFRIWSVVDVPIGKLKPRGY